MVNKPLSKVNISLFCFHTIKQKNTQRPSASTFPGAIRINDFLEVSDGVIYTQWTQDKASIGRVILRMMIILGREEPKTIHS